MEVGVGARENHQIPFYWQYIGNKFAKNGFGKSQKRKSGVLTDFRSCVERKLVEHGISERLGVESWGAKGVNSS